MKVSNKGAKGKVNLPVIRLKGIGGERPVVPISLCTALELSTLFQGSAEISYDDVEHMPPYIRDIKSKVIDNKRNDIDLPPANIGTTLAKNTLCSDKLRKLAQAASKAVQINQTVERGFKRKFREHEISVASYKKNLQCGIQDFPVLLTFSVFTDF